MPQHNSGDDSGFTFGVEIEALVSIKTEDFPDLMKKEDWPALFAAIANTLRRAGHPARSGRESVTSYDCWGVVGDNTITEPVSLEEGKKVRGIELCSPKFQSASFSEAAVEIQRVLFTLGREYGLLTVNDSCGLHVHVSAPSWEQLTLDGYSTSLKVLALVLLACEHILNGIVPRERLRREICMPSSKARRDKLNGMRLAEHVRRALHASTVDALIGVMCPRGRWARHDRQAQYNFTNFYWCKDPPRCLKTVEFRLFPATVSDQQIAACAELAIGLTRFALRAEPEEVEALLHRIARVPTFGLAELLETMGLSHLLDRLTKLRELEDEEAKARPAGGAAVINAELVELADLRIAETLRAFEQADSRVETGLGACK